MMISGIIQQLMVEACLEAGGDGQDAGRKETVEGKMRRQDPRGGE